MNELADEGVIRRVKSTKPEHQHLVMFKYIFGLSNWLNSDILDARGIVFNELSGQVVLRPYRKFFNEGQYSHYRDSNPPEFITNQEELEELIKLTEPPTEYKELIIQDKLDGSMISLSGGLTVSSGSFDSEHVEKFTEHMNEVYGQDFMTLIQYYTLIQGITLVFEYINPDFNPIVVQYPKEKVVLHGVIRNIDGYEEQRLYHSFYRNVFERPYIYPRDINIDKLMDSLEEKDVEGLVLKYITDDGVFRLKRKTSNYLKKHGLSMSLNVSSKASIRHVLEYLINDEFDDIEEELKNMTPNKVKALEIIREEFQYWQKLETMVTNNPKLFDDYRLGGEAKKRFFEEVKTKVENVGDLFIVLKHYESKDLYDKLLSKMVNRAREKIRGEFGR